MTTEELASQFDVVWSGRDTLCIPPAALAATCAQSPAPLMHAQHQPIAVQSYTHVLNALPGTMVELIARTRLNKATVYHVLARMRRQGILQATKLGTAPMVYGVRVTGQPE